MAEYIEKHRVAVRISMPGEAPLDGELALAANSEVRRGPETLLELLNGCSRVIPFLMPDDGEVLLVNRLGINWVVAGRAVDPDLVCPATFLVTRQESVHVLFTDGSGIGGLIQMELPDD